MKKIVIQIDIGLSDPSARRRQEAGMGRLRES